MREKLTRKEQALQTKKKIFEASISLFEEKGFDKVTIGDITERAGTAKGTFYLYFSSKKDIVYHSIEIYDGIARQGYESVKKHQTFEEQLFGFISYYSRQVKHNGKEILNAVLLNNLIDEEKFIVAPKREIYRSISKIIEVGFETGELSPIHGTAFYLESIIVLVQGLDYYWCNSSKEVDITEVAEKEIGILINGLLNYK